LTRPIPTEEEGEQKPVPMRKKREFKTKIILFGNRGKKTVRLEARYHRVGGGKKKGGKRPEGATTKKGNV